MSGLLFIAIECQVGVLYHSTSSTRALGVSLLQTAIVRVMHDVVHTPHSSLCTGTSLFNLHHLLRHIFSINPHNVSVPAQYGFVGLPRFQCDVFHYQISPIFVAPILSAPRCHCFDSPKHSQLQL